MKKIVILLSLLYLFCFSGRLSYGQTPDWLWALRAGGTSMDRGFSVTTDATGNVILAGGFKSTPLIFGVDTLVNSGDFDVFLVKYDASGNPLWARSAQGDKADLVNCAVADASGNIYLTGRFLSSSLTFGTVILTNSGNDDLFFVKYDPSGNLVWAKSAGGTGYDAGNSVAVNGSGAVYLTGYFSSPTMTLGSTVLTGAGSYDLYLAKYDAAGNVVWAKSAGSTGDDGINDVATDASGAIYTSGYFDSPALVFGSQVLTNAGSYDLFLSKYDTDGNVVWAKSHGGTGDDEATSVETDASGNIFCGGYFASPSVIFGLTTLTSAGMEDLFLVKFDAGGNVLWAGSAGGTDDERVNSVAVDASGNAYATGFFQSPVLGIGSAILTKTGLGDLYLAMYGADGVVHWATNAGGINYDVAYSVATDGPGNIYSTGFFSSPVIAFGEDTLISAGLCDLFLSKMESSITGIQPGIVQSYLRIFPVPARDQINISSKEPGLLSIHSADGVRRMQKEIPASITTLEVSSLPKGLYMVTLNSNGTIYTGKFIKQ